jgi:hypothetical protein
MGSNPNNVDTMVTALMAWCRWIYATQRGLRPQPRPYQPKETQKGEKKKKKEGVLRRVFPSSRLLSLCAALASCLLSVHLVKKASCCGFATQMIDAGMTAKKVSLILQRASLLAGRPHVFNVDNNAVAASRPISFAAADGQALGRSRLRAVASSPVAGSWLPTTGGIPPFFRHGFSWRWTAYL